MRLGLKIPLAIVALAVTLGVGFAVWLHASMASVTTDAARRTALAQLDVAASSWSSSGTLPPFAAVDDQRLPATVRAAAMRGERVSLLEADPAVAWAAQGTTDGRVLAVSSSWQDGATLMNRLDRSLAIGVVALVLLAGIAALLVARTTSRRLGAAERAARAIANGDLGVRVSDHAGGSDEVAALARTIDALAASAEERLISEKRVTADIAHDLRTPVTGLVAASALLPPGRPTELVRGQVDRLWRLVEDLLEVARLDESRQEVDAEPTTTSALARRGIAAGGVSQVELDVRSDIDVETDPRRVERVLVNLVANALKHGRAPVIVRVDGPRISVLDHGDGFPVDLLEAGPRRFRTGATERGTGHGLGLTIAAGQARALGATLSFANTDDGAVATLDLTTSAR